MKLVINKAFPVFLLPDEIKDFDRTSEQLISLVESGKCPTAEYFDPKVVEIPDNIQFEIDDDGFSEILVTYYVIDINKLRTGLNDDEIKMALSCNYITTDINDRLIHSNETLLEL